MVSDYRVKKVLQALDTLYPDAATELNFETPWQLLVATILSAQCTDKRVNIITARIFPRYPEPADLANICAAEIEDMIRDCGLFRNKARNLWETAQIIAHQWDGKIPTDRDTLMSLPGVGRKTANVVISNAFGQAAIAVDTHVFRLAHRLGWSLAKDPLKTEEDLMQIIPKKYWSRAHHWLILHGRRVCGARNPQCSQCVIGAWCQQIGVE